MKRFNEKNFDEELAFNQIAELVGDHKKINTNDAVIEKDRIPIYSDENSFKDILRWRKEMTNDEAAVMFGITWILGEECSMGSMYKERDGLIDIQSNAIGPYEAYKKFLTEIEEIL